MKWKQFFTPVSSIDGSKAREIVQTAEHGDVLYLDVRQPNEYEAGHIPGSKLIPLPELSERLDEIDPKKPAMIY